ncbi:MAG: CPBP family intramembrane metalloprotease [Deltaproteobacteria bacterium]|nr:MAG: CPBP family intramembrane metalloprotease [Deltaproteobacteria bacterium]
MSKGQTTTATNASLLIPYALPIFLYVGIASLPASLGLSLEANYALRLAAAAAALAWGWRRFVPLRGPNPPLASIGVGIVAGLLGTALWVAIKQPFYPPGGEPWPQAAFVLRLVASGSVVALFEELLFRGYVLGLVVQWDRARRSGAGDPFGQAFDRSSIGDLEPGAWTPIAVAVSTLAYTAGHAFPGEYPAAIAYGLLMAGLWIARKDLLSCVVAHGVTNVSLALYVHSTGAWAVW